MLLILLFFAPLSSEVFFAPSKQRQSADGTGHQEGILREGKREADAEERDGGEKSFISLLCYSRIRDLSNSLK